jgi:hypothetical protein
MLNVWICTYLLRPDRGLQQRFPKCAAQIPRDPRPVPRASVDTFLWLYIYFVWPLEYLIKIHPVRTKRTKVILFKVKSCHAFSRMTLVCLMFISPCILIYSYSKTNQMHLFLKLFILVKRSTCFGWSFRPSSGAQDCTYSNRHMSNSCCYLLLFDICLLLYVHSWARDDGRKDHSKHVERFTGINNLRNWGASCWVYYRNILQCTDLWTSDL